MLKFSKLLFANLICTSITQGQQSLAVMQWTYLSLMRKAVSLHRLKSVPMITETHKNLKHEENKFNK